MHKPSPFIKSCTFFIGFVFFSLSLQGQIVTNGTATDIGGGCYQLTTTATSQAGTIFSQNTIDLSQPFSESGSLNFGNNDAGADGICFIFATSNTVVGTGGGDIGYGGISPSFVVEYDTWVNGAGQSNDPNSDHAGIQQNGSSVHGGAAQLVAPINYPNLEDGEDHCFTVDWNPSSQVFVMTLDGQPIIYNGNIATIMGTGNVYWGFTASTGGATNTHVVCLGSSTPTLIPMQDVSICQGESVQLQADPNGQSYSWTFDPTLSSTMIANPTATPFVTTLYTVDIDFGCGQILTDDVLVTVIPPPTTMVSNDGPVCVGETVTLMASGGASYAWSGPLGFTSTQQNPSISNIQFNQSGLYTVIVTDAATGCTAEDNTFVDVFIPDPAEIFPTPLICQGDGLIQLSATPPWGTWGGEADNNGFINADALPAGQHIVTYDAIDFQGCMTSTAAIITIESNPDPTITTIGPLCEGSDLTLEGSSPGSGYVWGGPNGFSSTDQNPTLTGLTQANAGVYNLTVFQNNGCFSSTSLDIQITPGTAVSIDPINFIVCQSNGVIQMTASPTGGTWGGAADAAGLIDPTNFTTGTYSVTYTLDDGTGCIGMDEVFVDIAENPVVLIDPAGPFCDTDPLQQLVANPSGGSWGGEADANGMIDPAALGVGIFDVTYQYIDNNGCFAETMISIEVLSGTSPSITANDPFCQSDDPQMLIGMPAGGTWGGAADASGTVLPNAFPPGSYEVTYSVTPQGGCTGQTSIFIEILANPTATISGMGTICAGSNEEVDLTIETTGAAPIEVTYAIDGDAQAAVQFSEGTNLFPVDEAGDYTILSVIDASGCEGTGSGTASVQVVDAPMVLNFETTCDPAQENYVVTFEIVDGDPDSYAINSSIGGDLSDSPPYIFTSNSIASGEAYDFLINDANSCNPTDLMGSFSCQCTTDAGTMNTDPMTACEDEMITVTFNNDETLDGNDALIFVLHDGNGNSLGTIFAENSGLMVGLLGNMMPGVTYYVSAVAGDDNGMGGVDLTDDCLSVAFGTPVTWQALPDGNLIQDAAICEGEETILTFNLTGNGPFDVVYFDGSQNTTLENILDGHSISVMPSETTTYELIDIIDNSTPPCQNVVNSSVTITVNSNFETTTTAAICEGESIMLGGAMQTEMGMYADTLSSQFGCDSIVITSLLVNEIDTTLQSDTDCNLTNLGTFTSTFTNQNGCDSVVILTVTFSDTDTTLVNTPTCDPDEVGEETTVFTTPQGCDSTVIETFFLVDSDTTELSEVTCNLTNAGIFQTVFTGQGGCDSTVILTIDFVPLDTIFNENATCDPDSAGQFITTTITSEGCDSVVVETILLQPSDTTEIFDTSCDPSSVGVFETILSNQFGCDSTIILTIDFSESDTTELSNTTCEPDQAGIFETLLTTSEGCDSLVINTITLVDSDITQIMEETCNPAQVGVFETILTNQGGCDSTVILTVNFVPIDTTFIESTTCDPNEAGIMVDDFSTLEGCDSTVVETITLLPSSETLIPLTTCEPLDTGTVVVTLINQFGCDSTVTTITTLLPQNECGVEGTLAGSLIDCDETVGNIMLEITEGTAPFDYQWAGPSSGMGTVDNLNEIIEITNLLAGSYTVEITDDNGFSTTLMAEIEQLFAPNAFAEITQNIGCFGEADGIALASADGGQAPFDFLWSNGQSTIEADNLAAGTYTVTVTDANECTDEAAVSLTDPEPLELLFSFSNIDCFGQNEGFATAEVLGGQAPIQFALNGGPFQSSNSFFGLTEGAYEITAQDDNGCTISEAFAINAPIPIDVTLGEDLILTLGEESEITALVNYPFEALDTIIWNGLDSVPCENCLTQPIAPIVSTTIGVMIQAENGCTGMDNLTISINRQKDIYAPNVFSPNGDGANENFFLLTDPNFPMVAEVRSFLVFDRWGEAVFTAPEGYLPDLPDLGWDGTHRGQSLDPAVFIWVAEVAFIDGTVELFSGDVALVR